MPGFSELALGAAPIFGGALLGVAAGQIKGPDFRAQIKTDLDLLDRAPGRRVARRAALQRTIDQRIDDLVTANERSRELRSRELSYEGNWRDIVLFCARYCSRSSGLEGAARPSHWGRCSVVMIVISRGDGVRTRFGESPERFRRCYTETKTRTSPAKLRRRVAAARANGALRPGRRRRIVGYRESVCGVIRLDGVGNAGRFPAPCRGSSPVRW